MTCISHSLQPPNSMYGDATRSLMAGLREGKGKGSWPQSSAFCSLVWSLKIPLLRGRGIQMSQVSQVGRDISLQWPLYHLPFMVGPAKAEVRVWGLGRDLVQEPLMWTGSAMAELLSTLPGVLACMEALLPSDSLPQLREMGFSFSLLSPTVFFFLFSFNFSSFRKKKKIFSKGDGLMCLKKRRQKRLHEPKGPQVRTYDIPRPVTSDRLFFMSPEGKIGRNVVCGRSKNKI